LARFASQQRLQLFYEEYLDELTEDFMQADGKSLISDEDGAAYRQLPANMLHAALNGAATVLFPSGYRFEVTPARAFDAGFTEGYLLGDSPGDGPWDKARLRQTAAACIAGQANAKTCAEIGYLHGYLTLKGQ